MFLADGRLPIWLVAWICVVGIAAHEGVAVSWQGAVLVVGIFVINVLVRFLTRERGTRIV